jgi:peptidoglycan/xylan/chitin deacetylase (PgdA/CDA1 family)
VALAVGLAACTAPPSRPGPKADTAPTPAPAAAPDDAREVLASNERWLIVRPREGDTLKSIAQRHLGSADLDWQIAELNDLREPAPGRALVLPRKPPNPLGVEPDMFQTVPILCYHRLGKVDSKMVVSPENFAAQLEWLVRNDYRVVRLDQLLGFLAGREALPPRAVVITFDDGYESVHRHALPVLRRLGLPMTLFVYTDFVGYGDALSWAQLQEMSASGLVDIQAHSKSHRNLVERQPGEGEERYRASVDAEVRTPRELLQRRLPQARIRHYAYPYGDANELVLDTLTRHAYQIGVTVNPGGNGFFAQPLMLRRTMIFGDLDLEGFKAKLQVSRRLATP